MLLMITQLVLFMVLWGGECMQLCLLSYSPSVCSTDMTNSYQKKRDVTILDFPALIHGSYD